MPRSRAKKTRRVEHDPEISEGMARGPFANWWATENGEDRNLSGQDNYDAAPETPSWARRWAKKLAGSIVALNGASLSDLYEAAVQVGYPRDREAFGVHLGMEAIGSGLRWDDDVSGRDLTIKVPDYELWGPGCERSEPDTRFVK